MLYIIIIVYVKSTRTSFKAQWFHWELETEAAKIDIVKPLNYNRENIVCSEQTSLNNKISKFKPILFEIFTLNLSTTLFQIAS